MERASFEWELPYKPSTESDTPARFTGRVNQAWNKAMKVAKEKGQGLGKTVKRATYALRCQSGKGREVENSALRKPSTSLSAYDEKKLLKREREAFKLHSIDLEVPHGQLCAIVGPVGAGKSSLVQGMIGGATLRLEILKVTYRFTTEMRKTGGEVTFGGSVAYCAQSAWIQVRFHICISIYVFPLSMTYESQSATIRDNILFGAPYEEERYQSVVRDCCLLPDFEVFT